MGNFRKSILAKSLDIPPFAGGQESDAEKKKKKPKNILAGRRPGILQHQRHAALVSSDSLPSIPVRISLEDESDLRNFLKIAKPEWGRCKPGLAHKECDVQRVLRKLRDIDVTSVGDLSEAITGNTINDDLAQAGHMRFSRETLDSMKRYMPFLRSLEYGAKPPFNRQIGPLAPVPRLLSHHSTKKGRPASLPTLPGSTSEAAQQGRNREDSRDSICVLPSRDELLDSRFMDRRGSPGGGPGVRRPPPYSEVPIGGGASPPAAAFRRGRAPRLRGIDYLGSSGASAGTLSRRVAEISGSRFASTSVDASGLSDSIRLDSMLQASVISSDSLERGEVEAAPRAGLTRSMSTCSGSPTSRVRILVESKTEPRLALLEERAPSGRPQSGALALSRPAVQDHKEPSAIEVREGPTGPREPAWAASASGRRPRRLPKESSVRDVVDGDSVVFGEDMLAEQEALESKARLLRTVGRQQDSLRGHVARNIRVRLKEEESHNTANEMAQKQRCINIRKELGEMARARRDLSTLKAQLNDKPAPEHVEFADAFRRTVSDLATTQAKLNEDFHNRGHHHHGQASRFNSKSH